jgi:hypothetical protein
MCRGFSGKPEEKYHLEDLEADGAVLKCILRK